MHDWRIWQLIDSAFPTGTFAHSWGLEAAWQFGEVDGIDGLHTFLRTSVQQCGHAVLPLLSAAHRRPETLEQLDTLCDAFLVSAVSNRASRVQGRAFVATAARVWPSPAMTSLRQRVERTHAHAAPVSGAVMQTVGLSLEAAQRVALYTTARGVLAAAVRLGLVGSFDAQRLQHECGPWLEEVAVRCRDLTTEHLAQTAPLIDLFQSAHDRLYSRLFQS
jgi:urease accessory protein